MGAIGNQNGMKELLWSRLTSDSAALRLNERTDEEPEDFFVRISNSGQRQEVVNALRSVLIECLAGERGDDAQSVSQFLGRAFRLCDSIAAGECRVPLKDILLTDDPEEFGVRFSNLPELQELAARALLGLAVDERDFRFWSDIAQQCSSSLPYALNAAISIDLTKGMELLCETWVACKRQGVSDIVDWQAIFQIAVLGNDHNAATQALRGACMCYPEIPELFESIVHGGSDNRTRDLSDGSDGVHAALEFIALVQQCAQFQRQTEVLCRSIGQQLTKLLDEFNPDEVKLDEIIKVLNRAEKEERGSGSPRTGNGSKRKTSRP